MTRRMPSHGSEEEIMTTRRKAQIRLPDGSSVQAVDSGDANLDDESETQLAQLADDILEAAGRPHVRQRGKQSVDHRLDGR
jgi:hypothetical protein